MLESLTFSSCVDEVMLDSGRPDARTKICDYINTTVRECQALAFFSADMIEDYITPTADPYDWARPQNMYKIKAVLYADGNYADFIQPGKGQQDKTRYFYGSGSSIIFVGCGNTSSDRFAIAYYQYQPRLRYYPVGQRPAVWDVDQQSWVYYDLTSIGMLDYTLPANQELARTLVSHWLLYRHFDLIKEGGLAKAFKNIADQARSAMAFSLFSTLKIDLLNNEAHESLDRG